MSDNQEELPIEAILQTFKSVSKGEIQNAHFSHANVVMCTKEHYGVLEDKFYGLEEGAEGSEDPTRVPVSVYNEAMNSLRIAIQERDEALKKSQCVQCKKPYTQSEGSVGCPKCAAGVCISEEEFRKPLEAEPFGSVAVYKSTHPNHVTRHEFYLAGQPPYLDNASEVFPVYKKPPPTPSERAWKAALIEEQVRAEQAEAMLREMKEISEAEVLAAAQELCRLDAEDRQVDAWAPLPKLSEAEINDVLQRTAESIDAANIVMTHWPIVARNIIAAIAAKNGTA